MNLNVGIWNFSMSFIISQKDPGLLWNKASGWSSARLRKCNALMKPTDIVYLFYYCCIWKLKWMYMWHTLKNCRYIIFKMIVLPPILQWLYDQENKDNERCHTSDIYNNVQCGVYIWKFGKRVHSSGEQHGLGQEKKDLFSRSDPHCSGCLQDHCAVVSVHNDISIFNIPRLKSDYENRKTD